MGITIHYKGKLNSPDLTDFFLDEVLDIVKSMEWEYTTFTESKNDPIPLKGLFIKPYPKSEFLQFMVDKNGNLRNAILIEHFDDDHETTYINHIKTQYAPIEIHIAVVKLLKYLNQKYIGNLEVWDEGDYWQTADEHHLMEKFKFLNAKIEKFGDILDSISFEENSDAKLIADKIEEVFKKMNLNKRK